MTKGLRIRTGDPSQTVIVGPASSTRVGAYEPYIDPAYRRG